MTHFEMYSQGFPSLQDLINSGHAEDIPFTADDFPSLSKEPASRHHRSQPESRHLVEVEGRRLSGSRADHSWAAGWANCRQQEPSADTPVSLYQLPVFTP